MKRVSFPLDRLVMTIAVIAGILMASSCADTHELLYFDGVQNTTVKGKAPNPETVVQKNDLLSITVSSLNPEATAIFNAPNISNPTAASNPSAYGNLTTAGYLVNNNGDIQFPILGTVHAEGMTLTQLTGSLVKQLTDRKLLVDPIINIRHLNFKVSVLGEVARPGVFSIPNERISVMEALGLAGDITIYGKKENVLLIRDNDKGEREVKRLNMNSQEFLSTPEYYLKSNDVVYVEPIKNRVTRERNAQILPIIFSMVSLSIVIIDRIK